MKTKKNKIQAKPIRYAYIAKLKINDVGVSLSFFDVPCTVEANTTEEAIAKAKDVLGHYMWDLEEKKREIPHASNIQEIELKDGEIPVLIDPFMPIIREQLKAKFVNRTVTIPRWVYNEGMSAGLNFSKTLQKALLKEFNR